MQLWAWGRGDGAVTTGDRRCCCPGEMGVCADPETPDPSTTTTPILSQPPGHTRYENPPVFSLDSFSPVIPRELLSHLTWFPHLLSRGNICDSWVLRLRKRSRVQGFARRGREEVPQPYLCRSARAALAIHRPGDLSNGHVFPHSSGDWKSQIKLLTGLVSSEACLLGLQMAVFALCPSLTSLCRSIPGASLSSFLFVLNVYF